MEETGPPPLLPCRPPYVTPTPPASCSQNAGAAELQRPLRLLAPCLVGLPWGRGGQWASCH